VCQWEINTGCTFSLSLSNDTIIRGERERERAIMRGEEDLRERIHFYIKEPLSHQIPIVSYLYITISPLN